MILRKICNLSGVFILLFMQLQVNAQENSNPSWVRAVDWNPSGDQIAIGMQNGSVQIIDANTKETMLAFIPENNQSIYSLAWNPDGRRLAVSGSNTSIVIWDVITGQPLHQLKTRMGAIRSLSWSSDGALLATASQIGYPENVQIWDASSGQILFTPVVGDALAVAWKPEGTILAITKFGEIQLWDVSTQQQVRTIMTPEYSVAIAWSPDGKRLASGDTYIPENSLIRIWDVESGELLATLDGHRDVINSVEWSFVGNRLASASSDGTIRVWDIETEQLLQTYVNNDRMFDTAFSPYGGRLAFGEMPNSASNLLLQSVVPAPSFTQIEAILDMCNGPISIQQEMIPNSQISEVNTFIAQLESLPAGTIPPACAADLIAVASALASPP